MAIKLGRLILQPAVTEKKEVVDAPAVESPAVPVPAAKPAVPQGIRLGGLRIGGSAGAGVPAVAVADSPTAVAPAESPMVVANGTPEGFQALLDRLDGLMIEGQGVSVLTLDTTRHYVKDIYMELAKFPEFDAIFKDRDMHNVMAFVQRSTIQAKEVVVKKQTKAAVSASKKINSDFGDFGSFGDPSAKPITSQVAAAAAVGNAMALMQALDTSQVDGKERGKK